MIAFLRKSRARATPVLVVCNFTPVPRAATASACRTAAAGASCSTATRRATAAAGWATSAASRPRRCRRTASSHSLCLTLPPLSTALSEGRCRCLKPALRRQTAHRSRSRDAAPTAAAAPSSMRCGRWSTAAASRSSAWSAKRCASTAHVFTDGHDACRVRCCSGGRSGEDALARSADEAALATTTGTRDVHAARARAATATRWRRGSTTSILAPRAGAPRRRGRHPARRAGRRAEIAGGRGARERRRPRGARGLGARARDEARRRRHECERAEGAGARRRPGRAARPLSGPPPGGALRAELPLVADRERARFSTWYELFPRSAARRAGRARHLPRRRGAPAAMSRRWASTCCTCRRSTRSAAPQRKGRNNALAAEPGDVGSPWAIGAAEGGHKAIHAGARHARGLPSPRRTAARARASRSRWTSPSSARPTIPT